MYKKSLALFLLLLVVILLVTACNLNAIRGSGNLVTEARDVSGFDGIALSGSGEVIITQGEGESLTIETDDNIMEHIKAEVSGGTLNLGFEEGVNLVSATRLVFTVGVDELKSVSIAGSGDIESDMIVTDRFDATIGGSGDVLIPALTADTVEAKIGGSGEIDLGGEAAAQDVNIGGSGSYRGGDLRGELVKVSIGGSGNAIVWATDSLETDISGSGSVSYYGRPSVSTDNSGSGDVTSLGEK
jgi:predicted small secreted protein